MVKTIFYNMDVCHITLKVINYINQLLKEHKIIKEIFIEPESFIDATLKNVTELFNNVLSTLSIKKTN